MTLTSTATKTRGLHDHIVEVGGEDHPNAKVRFKLGDIVTTVIQCAGGETIIVSHDTNLPRPYSLAFRVQGTKGLWMNDGRTIYIHGVSPEPHSWEPFESYEQQHDHPLWSRHEAAVRAVHRHGQCTDEVPGLHARQMGYAPQDFWLERRVLGPRSPAILAKGRR